MDFSDNSTKANEHELARTIETLAQDLDGLQSQVRESFNFSREANRKFTRLRSQIRERSIQLGEYFSQAKELTSRPGCAGGWAQFLRDLHYGPNGYPRNSAERHIRRYQQSLNRTESGFGTIPFPESRDEQAEKVLAAIAEHKEQTSDKSPSEFVQFNVPFEDPEKRSKVKAIWKDLRKTPAELARFSDACFVLLCGSEDCNGQN